MSKTISTSRRIIGSLEITNAMLAGSISDDKISSAATWNAKQAALVSGTNIKTINSTSLLGSGDIVISGSDATKLPLAGGTLTGNLLATDNLYDIGQPGATRFRTAYLGTSLVAPLHIGGTSTTQTLTFKTTTGVGATGADHIFQVGSDGATEAMRILNSGKVGIGQNNPTARLEVVAGALASTLNALRVTGTLSGTSAAQNGSDFQITTQGTSALAQIGLNVNILAGATGAASITAIQGTNSVAGTKANLTGGDGNSGLIGFANATTTGYNYGAYTLAQGGNLNAANVGRATGTKNSATNIGMAGFALNAGSSPIHIGGFFGLMINDPTFVSSALIADNGTTTAPIFLARDNGAVILNLIDGGKMYLGGSSTPTAILHLAAGTATATTAPLKLTPGTNLTTPDTGAMEYNGTNLFFTRAGTTRESVICANAVNSVSPLVPNRTITVVIDGVTLYIHAKTSND